MTFGFSQRLVRLTVAHGANPVLHLWQANGPELLGQTPVIEDGIESVKVPVERQASTSVFLSEAKDALVELQHVADSGLASLVE